MKNIKVIAAFLLGLVISGVGVYALSINSKDVLYNDTNVSDALDDLYSKSGNGTGSWVKAIFTSAFSNGNGFPIVFYDKNDIPVLEAYFGGTSGSTHTIVDTTVFTATYIGGGSTSVTANSPCTIDGVHYDTGETTPTEHYLVGHEYIIVPD